MKDLEYLLVPVTERLPEIGKMVVIKMEMTAFLIQAYLSKHKGWCDESNKKLEQSLITHWLDLSVLTTKEKAINFAEQVAGFSFSQGNSRVAFTEGRESAIKYIEENKEYNL